MEIAEFSNNTSKNIEDLENKFSAAEGTINSIIRASSAAIGYGAGKNWCVKVTSEFARL